jgi:phosphate-selective porin OprO/OprP
MGGPRLRLVGALIIAAWGIGSAAVPVRAQAIPPQFREAPAASHLDAQLQTTGGLLPIAAPAPPEPPQLEPAPDHAAPSFAPADEPPPPALTPAQVEQIVADYLARREAAQAAVRADLPPPPPTIVPAAPLPDPNARLPATNPNENWSVVGRDPRLYAIWNFGPELRSTNGDFTAHFGGRTQYDTSFFSSDGVLTAPQAAGGIGPLSDSTQFRRARLRVDGTMYEQIQYVFEYEFLNDIAVTPTQPTVVTTVPAVTNAWVNFSQLPLIGNLKVGNQKDPIGLEHVQSSRFLDFIERSFNQDLFYGPFNNGYSPGITASNVVYDGRAMWAAGLFSANMNGGTNISGYGMNGDYLYVMRGVMLPFYEQGGRYMCHVGASMEFRDSDDGHVRVRTRGNIRNGPPGPLNAIYADTTYLQADTQNLLNLEGIYQWGPLMVQAEYCWSNINNAVQTVGVPVPTARGDVLVQGGYIEALYFLTGEHRQYDIQRGAFGRVIPHSNAFRVVDRCGKTCQGCGAWQIGIRYDRADLNDSGINGGQLDAVTFGVNWFINPNTKFQVNYDWTHRGSVTTFDNAAGAFSTVHSGNVVGLGTRLAIDF